MNWLQDIVLKFSVQGLAVIGLAYFRDIGKGGVRTVTVTNRDGEVTPVGLNEDYQGYIRAINSANYRLTESLDCNTNLYDVEQDVAIVMWLDRKQNPNGVMQAIQQAVAGNDILSTTFDKQVILNEEGLPENDYLMIKVVARMVSTYAGSSCPADVCAVYYDPCFEVPSRPEPDPDPDPVGSDCTLEVGGCCDYSVENVSPLTSNCVKVIFPNEFDYSDGGFMLEISSFVETEEPSHTFFQIFYVESETPTISEILQAITNNFDSNGGRYVLTTGDNFYQICDTESSFFGTFSGYLSGSFPNATQANIAFITTGSISISGTITDGFDFTVGINEEDTLTFQVNINGTWTDVTDEVVDGTWTSLNDCRTITDWRIIDDEDNVIDSGEVTATNCGTTETKTVCEWLQEHQEEIEALQSGAGGLTCETLQDCEVIGNIEDRLTDLEDALPVFVPYTGASQDVDLGDNQLTTDAVTFDATPTTAAGERVIKWNDTDGTLDLGMKGGNVTQQIGMEQFIHAKSATNSGISEGSVYYIAGAGGGNKLVQLARADSSATSKATIGIATETTSGGSKGYITTFGLVRALPDALFTGMTEGDTLYLSATTAGAFTNTPPSAPNHRIRIGYLVRKQSNNNDVFVSVQLGLDLDELCDVAASSPNNGDLLTYNSVSGTWVNSTTPTIPTLTSQLTNDSGFITASAIKFKLLADFTNTAVNTNTTNNVLGSVLIPANTVPNNSIIEAESWISRANGVGNPLHRIMINTSTSFTGATEIARISTSSTALHSKGERTFICKTGQIRGVNATTTTALDDNTSTAAPTTTAVDWTVDQYILTVANNATGETTTHELTSIKIIQP
jgi:hypothetical protein